MDAIIIYPTDEGHCAFVYVSDEFDWNNPDVAVPKGKPYLIVRGNDIPTDHTFFEAFEADFSNPDGVGTRK